MTEQYVGSIIEIVIFSSTEQTEQTTTASVDHLLHASLISKTLVDRLRVRYEENERPPVEDQQRRVHHPLGYVELNLHRSDVPKSQPETFLVVDSVATVVLRAAAVPREKESSVLTLGLEPQTEGMLVFYLRRLQLWRTFLQSSGC